MKKLVLTELIDADVLQQIQDGFSKYTGMAALTADADGVPVTKGSGFTCFCMDMTRQSEIGFKRCAECDRNGALKALESGKPAVYTCHAGLTDYAAPIMVDGSFIGSFIGGQVRIEDIDRDKFGKYAEELGVDPDKYIAEAEKIHCLSREDVEKAAEFLSNIAKILSEMAYNSYKTIENSRRHETAARSQTNFMLSLIGDLKSNMSEWMSVFNDNYGCDDPVKLKNIMYSLYQKSSEVYSLIGEAAEYISTAGESFELSETTYNIRELVDKVKESMASFNPKMNTILTASVDDSVPELLFGDPGRIGQILGKLITNSVRNTDCGKVSADISCSRDGYTLYLILKVSDTGKGLSPEALNEIRHYFSGEHSAETAADMKKAGLSIVHLLMKQMSGNIEIDSKENCGTVFTVCLPQLEIK